MTCERSDDVGSGLLRSSGSWKLRGTLEGGARQASDGPREVGGFG